MRARRFAQVDVFTARPYLGNPVAVVLDGSGLDDEAMQGFARWTNLSETTFVLPPTDPGADYRLRIFTPGGELPFAGHPTLGSCHAWLSAGGQPQQPDQIVQQCAKGLVTLRRDPASGRLAFAAPALQRSTPDATTLATAMAALALKPEQLLAAQWLDNGPAWLGLLLDSPETVLALRPDHAQLKAANIKLGVVGIESTATSLIARSNREARAFTASAQHEAAPWVEVRGFAAAIGIDEDPVTGSLNASLAQWLIADGRLPASYVASQGSCLGRAGAVHLARDDSGQVWVGGDCCSCISGEVML